MQHGLWWALGGTLVLSAAVALWPQGRPAAVSALVAAVERRTGAVLPNVAASPEAPALPQVLEPWSMPAARRDVFAPVLPEASAAAPEPVRANAVDAAPPPPEAPPLPYRYLGRMTTPEGRHITLLAHQDNTSLPVSAGTELAEGYVVESVDAQVVRLRYPPLGTVVDVHVPPPPEVP